MGQSGNWACSFMVSVLWRRSLIDEIWAIFYTGIVIHGLFLSIIKVAMDIYVHVAVGAAIGVLTKSTAKRVFPAIEEECDQSLSGKLGSCP